MAQTLCDTEEVVQVIRNVAKICKHKEAELALGALDDLLAGKSLEDNANDEEVVILSDNVTMMMVILTRCSMDCMTSTATLNKSLAC